MLLCHPQLALLVHDLEKGDKIGPDFYDFLEAKVRNHARVESLYSLTTRRGAKRY
jgi:hypothetical protein